MTVLVFPPFLPAELRWDLNWNAAGAPEHFGGSLQTVMRDGHGWHCSIAMPRLRGRSARKARLFEAWLSEASRPDRWFWLHHFARGPVGELDVVERVVNGDFLDDATNWASTADAALSINAGRLKITATAITDVAAEQAAIPVINGAPHAAVVDVRLGSGQGGVVRVRDSTNADIASGGFTETGLVVVPFTPAEATVKLRLELTAAAAGNYLLISRASLARTALVAGAGQNGNSLNVDGLPASTNGLLEAGSFIGVFTDRWELQRLEEDLDSDSGGAGKFVFEPGLHAAPADNAEIILYRPWAKMKFARHVAAVQHMAPDFAAIAFDCFEDVTP